MEWFDLILSMSFGFVELLMAFGFLLLAYKFSTLAKHYKVVALRELSLGFRFMFLSYLIPILSVFLGGGIGFEDFEYFEHVFVSLPGTLCMAVAFMFFFKSIKSVVVYANA